MSKRQNIDNVWCIPSFDDIPKASKVAKPTAKMRSQVAIDMLEDMDEALFDIAVDLVDNTSKVTKPNLIAEKADSDSESEDENIYSNHDINSLSLSHLLKCCEPKSPSELALSRQKQNEIINWLSANHSRSAILVICGPAGCGKTLAFKVIAEEFGFAISEWITPVDQTIDEYGRTIRQADRFSDFVLRATRYNNVLTNSSKRILVVKDLPNIFMDDCQSFFKLLEKYNEMGKEPLVFICTEGGSSRIMSTLFAQNVRDDYNIQLININATTQTAMKNMLSRVSKVLNARGSSFLRVAQSEIDEVLANNTGDIRSAILNLIFCSLKVPNMRKMKSECGSREETLGLLHGIGRVINPKRIVEGDKWTFSTDPDEIATFFRSQSRTFSYFLQENYINTMRTIENVEIAADILSLADVLNSEWRDPTLNSVILSLCVRGVMVANENPVTGWNPVKKPRNTDFSVKRNYEQAEIRWYESIINKDKPKKTKESASAEIEGTIIETD